jgi:hypothetical protein
MADFLSIDKVYEIRIRSTEDNMDQEFDQVVNFQYATTTPGTPSVLTTRDALLAFRTAFRTAYLPIQNVDFHVQRYELREIIGRVLPPGVPRPRLEYFDLITLDGDPVADAGTRLSSLEYIPPYCSVSVELRVDRVGREWFGVHRLGPVLEADQLDGHLTPGATLTWLVAAGFLKVPITLAGGGPGVETLVPCLFRKTAYLALAAGPAVQPAIYARPWDSISVATRLGTQLTRKMKIRQFGS